MTAGNNENVAVAFAISIGAGLSTVLGALVVFVPSLVRLANRTTLASGLGFSAGVMMYVSYVEIFQKSKVAFEASGLDKDKAYLFATVCFFAGVVLMVILNTVVTALLGGHHDHDDPPDFTKTPVTSQKNTQPRNNTDEPGMGCACHSKDPVADIEKLKQMAENLAREDGSNEPVICCEDGACCEHDKKDLVTPVDNLEKCEKGCCTKTQNDQPNNGLCENHDELCENHDEHCENHDKHSETHENHDESKKLLRMSLNTALAIGIHNFPEGLATFVATLNDPKVGFVLGIAIAIHNIPEGLCVAMPVYYATGSRWKALGWALLSGISEPVAALLGWAVLANSFSDRMYAILFGLVAGMMVIISVRELLPTAHRYDPDDVVVTYSFMGGMSIMALSLVLFVI